MARAARGNSRQALGCAGEDAACAELRRRVRDPGASNAHGVAKSNRGRQGSDGVRGRKRGERSRGGAAAVTWASTAHARGAPLPGTAGAIRPACRFDVVVGQHGETPESRSIRMRFASLSGRRLGYRAIRDRPVVVVAPNRTAVGFQRESVRRSAIRLPLCEDASPDAAGNLGGPLGWRPNGPGWPAGGPQPGPWFAGKRARPAGRGASSTRSPAWERTRWLESQRHEERRELDDDGRTRALGFPARTRQDSARLRFRYFVMFKNHGRAEALAVARHPSCWR